MAQRLKEIGFRYVTLDLQGYRSGSLNEGLHASLVASAIAPPAPEDALRAAPSR